MRTVVREHPGAQLLIAGRGDPDALRELVGEDLRPHVSLLGELTEAEKAAFLRSVDVYCAPNLLGESFGIVLIEALAAGAPVVASDLDAFATVLQDGAAGVLVRRGDARALARALSDLLADPGRRQRLSAAGRRVAAEYDWSVVARRVLAVYETVVLPGSGEVTASDDDADLAGLAGVPGDAPTRSALRRWVRH
jgi:phosphatidylinositol alpha-mannosyltransferase